MASIFLSYDRDDDARAVQLVAQLEKAGHSVWWDRDIKGGTEFGTAIEAALADAEKVIVLWSKNSVQSAWVRDEAAVGRDTGRLVPVTIDGTMPPLGFRQFQTIDLSRWKGRESSPQLQRLLAGLGSQAPSASTVRASRRGLPRLGLMPVAISALLLLLGLAAAFFMMMRGEASDPTIAVVAADNSPGSQQFADQVTTRIGALVSPSSPKFQLAGGDAADADLLLKIGKSAANSADLSLSYKDGGALLWSDTVGTRAADAASLAQVTAVDAQRALACAAEAISYRRERFERALLKEYVSACSQYDDAYGSGSYDPVQVALFEKITAEVPHFEPAWAKLFAILSDVSVALEVSDARHRIEAQLRRAEELNIQVGEMYLAEAALAPPNDFVSIFRIYREGLAKYPENELLTRIMSERLAAVGRMNDSVSYASRAVKLNPLSPANLQGLASALAYSGDLASGYEQLRKAEQLWPNAPTVVFARFRMDLRYGDPKEGLQLYRQYSSLLGQNPAMAAVLEARIDPTPAKVERALAAEREINRGTPMYIAGLIQALGEFGRKDEAIDLMLNYKGGEAIGYNAEVLFRPTLREVWRDPRSMAAAAHLGLLQYWKTSGQWPDFCFDPTLPNDCRKEAAKYR